MPTLEGVRVSPIERKLRYVDGIASDKGIDLSSLKWSFELPKIFANSDWSVYIRLLLDLSSVVDLYFDPSEIQYPLPEIYVCERGRYGITKYDRSLYNSEELTWNFLENLLWDFQDLVLKKCTREHNLSSKALQKHTDSHKNYLLEKEVAGHYTENMFMKCAFMEAKAIHASYTGFTTVGTMIVSSPKSIKVRKTEDWKTEETVKSYQIYEAHVGFSRVGYMRVVHKKFGLGRDIMKRLAEEFRKRIEEFHKRTGGLIIEVPYPVTILGSSQPPPVIFPFNMQHLIWHQKRDLMHYKGGGHQIRLQNIIIRVKDILNRRGIVAQHRLLYINFAEEYVYLYYPTEEEKRPEEWGRSKEYKKNFDREYIVDKYKSLGADEGILREIIDAIGMFVALIPPP